MTAIRPSKWLLAAFILLTGGLIRLPLEQAFSKDLERESLSEARLNLSLRQELGQSTFIAVLGGFRSLVASVVEIQAIKPWQQQNYAKVEASYALCTTLQPRNWRYWDWRAWMSSHNAFEYYTWEDLSRPGLKPQLRQNLIDHAIKVLKNGMEHLPLDFRLPYAIARLAGDFRKNQQADHYQAAQWYYRAFQLRPRYRFLYRAYVYELAKAPGHELEAWRLLVEMFNSGPINDSNSDRTKTGMTLMVTLFPTIKTLQPDTVMPPELVPEASRILAEEAARREKVRSQRAKEEAEIKALEDAILLNKKP